MRRSTGFQTGERGDSALPSARSAVSGRIARVIVVSLILSVLGLAVIPAAAAPTGGSGEDAASALWTRLPRHEASAFEGKGIPLSIDRFRAYSLDRPGIENLLAAAPQEFSSAASRGQVTLTLPAPDGRFQTFSVQESPIMEPALAAKYPNIHTYIGEGISDPTATMRFDLSPLGFHAAVRGELGAWYIDPYYHLDQGVYASYFRRDLNNIHGTFVERVLKEVRAHERAVGEIAPSDEPTAMRTSVSNQLRTYRLALVSDPAYAADFPGNVTAAKVALLNRVNQIFEDETAVRLVLIGNNNLLNLDTAAQATGANGPCGSAPCYTAAQLGGCTTGVDARNNVAIGQIVGAENYDIGHIVLGGGSGGFAPGRVGTATKAQGCTGQANPVGDAFAVDFVAHEMGHQFSARHTWNGANCAADQWTAGSNIEPGSGSSIMGYAGVCGADNLQPNSDPHFSQKSFDQITNFVTDPQANVQEVQNVSLRQFDTNGDSFTLTLNGTTSDAIVRGSSYNAAVIQTELATIGAAGATVQGFGGSVAPDDTGFQVTFAGTADVNRLAVTNQNNMTGFVGTTAQGGPPGNGGAASATNNSAPNVTAPGPFTIPRRTPFALTGGATDPDADTVTFSWEQNDAGAASIALNNPAKTDGALFRQFSTALTAPPYNGATYNSAGASHPTTNPTRVFPDMAQILANNTNADSGDCPTTGNRVDCYSEFLPTAAYTGALHFRVTGRDGNAGAGGVGSADSTVNLGPATSGPFRVTSPNTAVTYTANTPQTITWDIAQTNIAPIGTANVDILFSSDGGNTFPTVLASSTPNDGSQSVTMPDVDTTQGRVMIRAVGNIFFDVSNANFTLVRRADMELVSKADSQDPAFAGESVTYTIRARNNGPSPVANARVVDVLPTDLAYSASSIPCSESPSDTLNCGLGALAVGAEASFTVTATIPRDLVHNAGAPVTVSNTATADSELDDPDPSNDQKTESTLIKAKADLEILSFNAVNPPAELIIGEPASVTMRKVITNEGPSAPMDVRVNRAASSTPNATVSPASTSHVEEALGYREDRTVDQDFEIECTAPGPATFTFDAAIGPERPDDIEVDPSDNSRQTSFTLECIMPVAVNIKPGSFVNPINLKSNGVIPLAVLTTAAGEYGLPLAFDATTIQPRTTRFGPEAVVIAGGGAREAHEQGHIEDAIERSDEITQDGDLDMVLHYRTQQSRLTGGETEACVRGKFVSDGVTYTFHGCDLVSFVP